MAEQRWRDPAGNEWVTIETPSAALKSAWPVGTVEVPMVAVPVPEVSPFIPIEPAPFWLAALDLLQMTQEDVLNAVPEGPERESARINIQNRKTYVRHDPMVDGLAVMKGIPPEQMDSLWLFVQANYH